VTMDSPLILAEILTRSRERGVLCRLGKDEIKFLFASTKPDITTSPWTSSRGFFPKYRIHLRCKGHSEFNLHSAVSSCVTISSCVAIRHCVGMSVYVASLLVWVALLQGAFSQTGKHMHGEKVRHKIATKTKPAEKGGGHCPLVHTVLWRAPHAFRKWAEWHDECIVGDGVRGRFGLLSGGWGRGKWSRLRASLSNSSGEKWKVKFGRLRGHRSAQNPKDNQFNGCTPRVCTSACKARGF